MVVVSYVATLFFKINQINYINVYVYTYRKMVVVSPAAANGKREGLMSGGDSAGEVILIQ